MDNRGVVSLMASTSQTGNQKANHSITKMLASGTLAIFVGQRSGYEQQGGLRYDTLSSAGLPRSGRNELGWVRLFR